MNAPVDRELVTREARGLRGWWIRRVAWVIRVLTAHLERLQDGLLGEAPALRERATAAVELAAPKPVVVLDPEVRPPTPTPRPGRGVLLPQDHERAREKMNATFSLAMTPPKLRNRYARGRHAVDRRSLEADPYDPTYGANP